MTNLKLLTQYITNFIQEELTRNNHINHETIDNAIDAFCGGASETGKRYEIEIKETGAKVEFPNGPNPCCNPNTNIAFWECPVCGYTIPF